MATPDTQQKILHAAVVCFNRHGVAGSRLQYIADEAFVSLGNMTYHFCNKEAIVQAIWEKIAGRQRTLLAEFRVLPLFEDIDRLLASLFALQQQYAFFYTDTLDIIRNYPEIEGSYRQQTQWQISQLALALQFNQARGALLPALEQEAEARQLAGQFWQLSDTWIYYRSIQGLTVNDYRAFRKTLWHLLSAYFTDMGIQEFRQTIAMLSDKDPIFGN